ncbi:peroxiredoxin [Dysgonomonas sp. PH5-45]|uniref:TlpA family protein disulfide reductase n=1 Tax=unclassified Dysgonomonas TaxID=2630389 RepID=UPI0024757F5A|nr:MULTISPECIES: TlpA disulfide reductase family protein [unclassified Dysgonomonas]MDH6355423.1 peroxiredoxin [Dysgonomonas sp. PH5-45]MDH6388320.1 peroxiredoxin [Dysgonomonas sp. PH5-37]
MKRILLVLMFICMASGMPAQENDRGYVIKVGDMAPDFEMYMPDGTTMKLSELRGKVVMLQFTASWCGVCRKEMPFIEKDIWQKHKTNPGFALYGIDLDEPAEKVIAFAQKTGVTYPLGLDIGGRIFGLYAEKGAGVTRNVIIDKDGKIVMLTRLYDPEEFAKMVSLLDRLLAQ